MTSLNDGCDKTLLTPILTTIMFSCSSSENEIKCCNKTHLPQLKITFLWDSIFLFRNDQHANQCTICILLLITRTYKDLKLKLFFRCKSDMHLHVQEYPRPSPKGLWILRHLVLVLLVRKELVPVNETCDKPIIYTAPIRGYNNNAQAGYH